MTQLTIIVEFETLDGSEEAFTALMRDHACRTLGEEPGCLRFEVIKPVERDGTPILNKVMVNELYADEAALAAHEANPRMPVLRAATGPLLKSRRLIMARALDELPEETGLTPDQLNASNDG
jgi:(4S)-4-hydroxy-5-phosphonooxypentane-2,3-dione isomerase